MAAAFAARRDLDDRLRREARERRHRLHARRAADARRRRVLGLARQPASTSSRAIRNLPDPPPAAPPPAPLAGRDRSRACSARCSSPRASARKNAITLGFGVSLVDRQPRPGRCGRSACPSGSPTRRPGSRSSCGSLLPFERWLFGDLKMDFSIFIVGGLMIVVGATWTIIYNADVLLGAAQRARSDASGALAPVLRIAIAYPLRSRFRTGVTLAMFTLVVFTLVVGATTTGSFVQRLQRRRRVRRRLRRPRDRPRRLSPIADMRGAPGPAAPGLDAATVRVRRQPVRRCRSRRARSGRRRHGGAYSSTASTARSSHHTTYGFAAHRRAATARRPRSGTRWRRTPGPRRRRPVRRPAPDELELRRRRPNFRLHGFYLEDQTFAPVPRRRPRPADRPARDA